ncbi:MAG: hypothetical protein ACI9K5_003883 [Gammaproteobacteria bacterium]|jgi:hypothetical protein
MLRVAYATKVKHFLGVAEFDRVLRYPKDEAGGRAQGVCA